MMLTYKHRIRVYLEDTDQFGVVYHGNYVKFFERGRIEWLRTQNISLTNMSSQGYSLMVAKLNIHYLTPSYVDDELIIHTELIKHKMSLAIFKQEIYSINENPIASAEVKVISLDKENTLCPISTILSL